MHFYLHLITVKRQSKDYFLLSKLNFGTPRYKVTLIIIKQG